MGHQDWLISVFFHHIQVVLQVVLLAQRAHVTIRRLATKQARHVFRRVFRRVHKHVCRHVQACVYIHVYTHVYTHVYRHVAMKQKRTATPAPMAPVRTAHQRMSAMQRRQRPRTMLPNGAELQNRG